MCGLHVVLTLGANTASGTPVTCDCYYTLILFHYFFFFCGTQKEMFVQMFMLLFFLQLKVKVN